MLTLTKKEYEIEEKIQVKDENGDLIVDYMMKITPEEKMKIKDIIFDERDVVDGRKLAKLEKTKKIEEYEILEAKVLERAKQRQEEFEKIIFKDEKETIIEKAGMPSYLDLVDMLFDFFVQTFAEKKSKQINTLNSHLRKITGK